MRIVLPIAAALLLPAAGLSAQVTGGTTGTGTAGTAAGQATGTTGSTV